MRLAVTGGTGFVGSHLIDAALAAGHEITALTRHDQAERDGVDWVHGDLDSRDALEWLVDQADAIIHVAGTINAPNAAGFEKGNVAGTLLNPNGHLRIRIADFHGDGSQHRCVRRLGNLDRLRRPDLLCLLNPFCDLSKMKVGSCRRTVGGLPSGSRRRIRLA